jgi:signal transduction histidine kinase
MLEHEIELSDLKSRYVSMAAHDLRNPLTLIQLAVSSLHQHSDRLTPAKKEDKYHTIQTSIKVMVDMLDDILTLGQVESGKLNFEPVEIDVLAFCESMVSEIKQAAGVTRLIHFTGEGECRTAYLDARLLRHILGNLLSNALKYSPENCPVMFSSHCDSNQITFRIQDQGIGIPDQDQPRLFDTFYRASNAKKLPGTGLGLAIVKQSVELHGGTITFESREDVGTTFTVVIPKLL